MAEVRHIDGLNRKRLNQLVRERHTLEQFAFRRQNRDIEIRRRRIASSNGPEEDHKPRSYLTA